MLLNISFFEKQKSSTNDDDDDDEVRKIMLDEDENSIVDEEEVHDGTHDPEWSDAGEDEVEDDSVESNSKRNVR